MISLFHPTFLRHLLWLLVNSIFLKWSTVYSKSSQVVFYFHSSHHVSSLSIFGLKLPNISTSPYHHTLPQHVSKSKVSYSKTYPSKMKCWIFCRNPRKEFHIMKFSSTKQQIMSLFWTLTHNFESLSFVTATVKV